MSLTSLCYLEKDGKYLMLYRNKKQNDMNQGKWIGVGGGFEKDETPEECMLREVREETGLTLVHYSYRGLVTFVAEGEETQYMHLFTADQWEGTLSECTEGTLEWIDKEEVLKLELWEGDRVFFRLLEERKEYFSLKLCYEGDKLVKTVCFPE